MEQLTEVLELIDAACKRTTTKYKIEYFTENKSVEIRFKSKFRKKYNKDLIQVGISGINYWSNYNENYSTVTLTELELIINTVFI